MAIPYSYSPFFCRFIIAVETVAQIFSSNGQLNEEIVRDNFAIASITPMANTNGDFANESFLATTFQSIKNLTSFEQVDFIAGPLNSDNSFLNLVAVFVNSELSEFFQTESNQVGEPRSLVFTLFGVNSPFFQDPGMTEVGSVILSLVVDSSAITFENFSSPIEFNFQVTEVCVFKYCSVAWEQLANAKTIKKVHFLTAVL